MLKVLSRKFRLGWSVWVYKYITIWLTLSKVNSSLTQTYTPFWMGKIYEPAKSAEQIPFTINFVLQDRQEVFGIMW